MHTSTYVLPSSFKPQVKIGIVPPTVYLLLQVDNLATYYYTNELAT